MISLWNSGYEGIYLIIIKYSVTNFFLCMDTKASRVPTVRNKPNPIIAGL